MTMSAQRSRPSAPTKNAQDPAAKNALPVGQGPITQEGQIVQSGNTSDKFEWDTGTTAPLEGK